MAVEMEQQDNISEKSNDQEDVENPNDSDITAEAGSTEALEPLVEEQPKRRLILEPAVFLFFFAINLSSSITQNQVLYQTCIVIFNYNESTCEPLMGISDKTEESASVEDQVQVYASKIMLANSLIKSIIPAILSLFIGPWSDKFGRRPILITLSVAYTMEYLILSIISLISATQNNVNPWVYLVGSVPSVVCGGSCALVTIIYAYVADTSVGRARGIRMLIVEAFIGVGSIVGSLCSGYILEGTSFATVFCISFVCMMITAVYMYFMVVESLKPEQLDTGSKVRAFFRFELVVDFVRTSFKKRDNFKRGIIWLTIISMTMARFITEGESNVMYFFVTKQFNWTLQNYNLFTSINSVILILGGIGGVLILRKVFNCSIVILTMVAYLGGAFESLVRAVAAYTWEMYLGAVLGFMSGIPSSMSLAILSHSTPPTETAKVFALTTALETLAPLGAAPLYTAVYDASISTYPGAYNFISMGLYVFACAMMTTIFGLEKFRLHITPF